MKLPEPTATTWRGSGGPVRIDPCPPEGSGVHQWIHRTAVSLLGRGLPEDAARRVILTYCSAARDISREVEDSLVNARRHIGATAEPRRPRRRPRRRTPTKPRLLGPRPAIKPAEGWTCADWWEVSPVRFEGGDCTAEVLDALFPGDPLLCMGSNTAHFTTRPRSFFRGREGAFPLMVAGPMSARSGPRKRDGAPSEHTLANTAPRQFLVLETDPALGAVPGDVLDYGAAVVRAVDQLLRLRLALVLLSGSRSVHAWWQAAGVPEHALKRVAKLFAHLHVDPAQANNRSQFVRTPDATRDNGARQSVLYFDPS